MFYWSHWFCCTFNRFLWRNSKNVGISFFIITLTFIIMSRFNKFIFATLFVLCGVMTVFAGQDE